MILLYIFVGIIVLILLAFWFYSSFYVVVRPDEAHVVVMMGGGRKIYMSRQLEDVENPTTHEKELLRQVSGSAYWFFDFLMEREILPLANVKLKLSDFELRAKGDEMSTTEEKGLVPFKCSVVAFLSVQRPDVVIEKLEFAGNGFKESVRIMLEEQVQAIARATAMEQDLLNIMVNRKEFSDKVKTQTNGSLDGWGLRLEQLEIVDINDAQNSTVIQDYEHKQTAKINSESRQVVAIRNKQAELVEAENNEEAENRKTAAEESIKLRKVAKLQKVNIEANRAKAAIAEETEKANRKQVEAKRAYDIGTAEVQKQALIIESEGKAEADIKIGQGQKQVLTLEGEGQAAAEQAKGLAFAEVQKEQGLAEAEVIRQKGLSEAESQDKLADAMTKLNKSAIGIEQIKAAKEVEIARAKAWAEAMAKADIKFNNIAGGGETDLFGMSLGGKMGGNLAQMIEAFKAVSDTDAGKVVKNGVKGIKKMLNS